MAKKSHDDDLLVELIDAEVEKIDVEAAKMAIEAEKMAVRRAALLAKRARMVGSEIVDAEGGKPSGRGTKRRRDGSSEARVVAFVNAHADRTWKAADVAAAVGIARVESVSSYLSRGAARKAIDRAGRGTYAAKGHGKKFKAEAKAGGD